MSGRRLFSLEAEQAVLGSLLLDNSVFDRIGDKLTAADFYSETHRLLYGAISELLGKGQAVDVRTLHAALEQSGNLEKAGGLAYIGALFNETPTAKNAAAYAKTVIDHRMERDLASAAAEIHDLAISAGPILDRMDAAQALLLGLTDNTAADDPVPVSEIMTGWVELLEERFKRGGEITGLSTGLADLDVRTNGLQPGNLVIVAGRPGMGKTSLAMQFARRTAQGDGTAAVFSMEMSRYELVQLAVAAAGRISSAKLRSGDLQGDDWDRVTAGVSRLHEKRLIIDDSPNLSVEQVRARARRVKRKYGLSLIVVDYLQLMAAPHAERRDLSLAHITSGLKRLARELEVPVILLSQLNRALEQRPNKRPLMSDLRDSGAIEADADIILFVYREEVYDDKTPDKGTAEIIIGKHRMGETGTVRAAWLGEFNTFQDLAPGWRSQEAALPPRATGKDTFEVT